MHEVDAGLLLEQLHGEVMLAAVADGGVEQRRPRVARASAMKPRKSVTEGSAGLAARISSFDTRLATGNRSLSGSIAILA